MSKTIENQIRQQMEQRSLYDRLLTTEELSALRDISQYELRKGAKEGRYPVVMLGSPKNKYRKMRWNLEAFDEALRQQMEIQMND